ncbi:hypothetical protein [Staphylothermus hellenicus]|uniref:Uncharacterized protein n=1 Tax=Staphylothermus hellenicus (strain DSM 12710 / JCM 10830 / BK20S6-10-b1 / P8) TaxID=591019 RepID=D7D9T5_STAHD|nr:hypothetical protein [Staphylothermus hellenicus]ADI32531.1 hypothetical protein Shell_1443 [Staphylothermus hellenicus DSM 12710]
MVTIYRCFYIEGNDLVWFDLVCGDNMVKICIVSRENISRSRKISKHYDVFLRKIIIHRQKYIKCHSLEREKIYIKIAGRKRFDDHLYSVLEIQPLKKIIYVPQSKVNLLRKCMSNKD